MHLRIGFPQLVDRAAGMQNRGVILLEGLANFRQTVLGQLTRQTHGDLSRPDRKSTRLNSSHIQKSRMPSSA